MRQHMNLCTAERDAAQRKKPPRRHVPDADQNRIDVVPVAGAYGMTESVVRAKP